MWKSCSMRSFARRYQHQKQHEVWDNSVKHMGESSAQVEASTVFVPPESSLDGLPFEMKLAVLHEITDLASLQTLTSVSPSYHQAYRSASHSILSSVLLSDVHPDLLFDVLSIADVIKLARADEPSWAQLKSFVERCKTKSEETLTIEGLDSGTLEMVADVHLAVHHAANQYCRLTLSYHPVTGESLTDYRPLSHSETRRIHRAFYRYELFCILFREADSAMADVWLEKDGHLDLGLKSDNGRWKLLHYEYYRFLILFKAWEVEEMVCVRDYIIRRYKALIQQCEPEFQKQCYQKLVPGGSLDASSRTESENWSYNMPTLLEHYLSLGLLPFNRITEASPKESSVMLLDNIGVIGHFLSDAFTKQPPLFSYNYREPIDEVELQEINEDRDGRSNAAWTWSNDYKNELWYFRPVTADVRGWGYVFWDKERLDGWGVLDEEQVPQEPHGLHRHGFLARAQDFGIYDPDDMDYNPWS